MFSSSTPNIGQAIKNTLQPSMINMQVIADSDLIMYDQYISV